jgi:hypothetical protein
MLQSRILLYLQNTRCNPEFAKWNWTSFKHLISLLDAVYGPEIQCIALQLVEEFYEQFTQKQRFLDKAIIREEIDRAKRENGLYHITEIEQQCTDYA